MVLSSNELAEYLRGSVSFDFTQKTVSSYEQIRRLYEDFYVLEEPYAFTALLHDVIGYDNQLIDIFTDLHTADRGFRYFANIGNRENPNTALTFFLNDQRFEYHRDALAKVCFAINTWLSFFGSGELKTVWSVCPVCGSPLMEGICTGGACKMKQDDFLSVMIELQTLLEAEKGGTETHLPEYYKNISPRAQFASYKARIDTIRGRRDQKKRSEEESKRKNAFALATKELKKLEEKARIEAAKDDPHFEDILNALNTEPLILDALSYGEQEFAESVNSVIERINVAKQEIKTKKENEALTATAKTHFLEFITCKASLESELGIPEEKLQISRLRETFEEAEKAFNKACATTAMLPQIFTEADGNLINEYRQYTRTQAQKMLLTLARRDRFAEHREELLSALRRFKAEYDECLSRGTGADKLLPLFMKELENNPGFIEYRKDTEWNNLYLNSTVQLKGQISRLIDDQARAQENSAHTKLSELSVAARQASPVALRSREMRTALASIQKDPYYNGIRETETYKADVLRLEKDIALLEAKEAQYLQIKRAKKIAVIAAATVVAVALILIFAIAIPKACRSSKNDESVSLDPRVTVAVAELAQPEPQSFFLT